MPSNKVWRGCLEEFERTNNKYSIFFKLPNNLVNIATTARTLQVFWHGPLGHEYSKATYLELWYCGVPLSSWMHQLQDPKRSGWNDSSAAPRDFAYALGMGFAGWGNRLWVQELRYYEYIIYDFQVCVNVFFFTLVASPIFHMSLTNWANRCFKTGGIDYCKSDPGKHFVDLHTLFQSLSNLFPQTWWVSIYWLPKFMKNPILVYTLTPLPGAEFTLLLP